MHERRPAVFLDRDGTVNEEVEYLDDPARLRIFPGVAEAIRRLNGAGYLVVIVSNQSGVGRGRIRPEAVAAIHERLQSLLAQEDAHIDAIYYCPHHPADNCACRKPRPGMLKLAADDFPVDLGRSVMIGDKASDLEAGRTMGCRTILVLTGYGTATHDAIRKNGPKPDHIAGDLLEAADWILDGMAIGGD